MELQSARQIIDTLSQGIHPVTGEAMPADSPYNEPAIIRALFTVARALEGKPARVHRVLPPNAGKPWSAEEDARLEAGFAAGGELEQLASELGRTALAVESRLVMRGKLPPRPGIRVSAPAAS